MAWPLGYVAFSSFLRDLCFLYVSLDLCGTGSVRSCQPVLWSMINWSALTNLTIDQLDNRPPAQLTIDLLDSRPVNKLTRRIPTASTPRNLHFHFLLFIILSVSLCKKSFFIPSRILFKFLLSARRFYWVVASQAESERWVCQVSTTTAAVAEAGPSSCPNSWTRTVSWHVHT